jgi:hypothetical protein
MSRQRWRQIFSPQASACRNELLAPLADPPAIFIKLSSPQRRNPEMEPTQLGLIVIVIASLIVLFLAFVFFLLLGRTWIKALMSGAPVSVFSLLGMLLRGTPRSLAVDAYIQLNHRGSPATIQDVELQYIANRHRVRNARDLVALVEEKLSTEPQLGVTP